MKNSNNLNHVLEVFWLIIAVFTLLLGLFLLVRDGFRESYMFFIMSGLSFLLFYARRSLRRKNDKD